MGSNSTPEFPSGSTHLQHLLTKHRAEMECTIDQIAQRCRLATDLLAVLERGSPYEITEEMVARISDGYQISKDVLIATVLYDGETGHARRSETQLALPAPIPVDNDAADYEALGRLLMGTRKARNMSQRDLEGRLGWYHTRVNRMESGIGKIDVIEFIKVAKVFEIDPAEFLQFFAERIKEKNHVGNRKADEDSP